ncbi:MAG TPA: hypothetical protein VGQ92_21245 [Actinoplanes sp.]|nr:hypothetical protein [Actinoplanes sp.]
MTTNDKQLLAGRRAPMPFTRLLRVQLRAWRGQRGMVWLTGLAVLVGVVAVMFGVSSLDENPAASLVEEKFGAASVGFTLLWLAVGVLAGAAPFRSGWAGMVLSVAPRRLRWLAASYVSMIVWAAGTTLVFGTLGWAAVTAFLAGGSGSSGAGLGVLGAMPAVAVKVLIAATVGFALGSAARSVAIPLMAGYVATSFIPFLDRPTKGLSRLIDLDSATEAAAGVHAAPHGIGPVVAALVLWAVVPAAIAAARLQRSDVR